MVGVAKDAERAPVLGIEPLDRLEQTDHRDLLEIFVGDAAVPVATREVVRDSEMAFDQRVAERAVMRAAELDEVGVERTGGAPSPGAASFMQSREPTCASRSGRHVRGS